MSSSPAAQLSRQGWAGLTAEQRAERTRPAREAARKATLDRYVESVIARAPELSQEQRDVIATAFAGTGAKE